MSNPDVSSRVFVLKVILCTVYLRKKDLERVNEELVPLQEDDDETEGTRQAVKLRRGTKSRQNTEFDAVEDVGKVEAFVAGKIAHFKIIAEVRSPPCPSSYAGTHDHWSLSSLSPAGDAGDAKRHL